MSVFHYGSDRLANVARALDIAPGDLAAFSRANTRAFRKKYRHSAHNPNALVGIRPVTAAEIQMHIDAFPDEAGDIGKACQDVLLFGYNCDAGRVALAAICRIQEGAIWSLLQPNLALDQAKDRARERASKMPRKAG